MNIFEEMASGLNALHDKNLDGTPKIPMAVKTIRCPRCMGRHESLKFFRFQRACEWEAFATCPRTDEPILLKRRGGRDA